MEFGILGPLAVRTQRGEATLGGPKPRALLTLLLLHPNEPVSAERLALALWGEDAPAGAIKTVQVHVSRLRKALGDGDAVTTTPAGYVLRVRPGELDAERFERLFEDGRGALEAGQPREAATLLRDALSLWRGPPLAELAFEPFAQAEITRLEEQRLAALEARVEADLAAGRHEGVVGELQALVAAHPARERLAGQLMLALYRCGRQAEALDAYSRVYATLMDAFGLEPSAALQTLQGQILRQSPLLAVASDDWRVPEPAHPGRSTAPAPAALPLPEPLRRAADELLVGRGGELRALQERWRATVDGGARAIFLAGEAGIGKTRLAAELAGRVHAAGGIVLYGRCDEELSVPYQPFVEALRPCAIGLGPDWLREALDRHVPELGRLLPELGSPPAADPASARLALFEAVAAFLATVTRDAPVLLVLDDLHWAPNPTLLLLRHVLRSDRAPRVLVVGTYRDTELKPGDPLGRLLAALQPLGAAQRVRVRGLDDDAIAALLGREGHAPELVGVLRTQTGGNPFFLRELLAHAADSRTTPGADVPTGLRQLIGERVARLSDAAAGALRVGAVAGPAFSLGLIERLRGDALDALDEAVAAGLLTDTAAGEYAFTHALVRQTLYEDLSSARRMRLHRAIGEALEALAGDAAALAHHFCEAVADGQALKAADYALAAGREAVGRLGYEEAAAHFEHGLSALERGHVADDERRLALLLALGEARWDAGERVTARTASLAAADLAEQLGDTAAIARAALTYAGMQLFEGAEATTHVALLLSRALAALGDEESALRAQVMGRLSAALAFAPVQQRRPELSRAAAAMARRVGDRAELAYTLGMCAWADRRIDNVEESLARAREVAELANEVRDGRLRSLAHEWMLAHLLELGDRPALERERQTLERLAGVGEPKARALVASMRAAQAHLDGRLDRCEELAHEALALGLAEGSDEAAMQGFGSMIGSIRREQGRLGEMVEAIENFADQNPSITGWRCAQAYAYAELDRVQDARTVIAALEPNGFAAIPKDALWAIGIAQVCQAVHRIDDVASAAVLYDQLAPYADRCVVSLNLLSWGSVARTLGLLASTLGRHDVADAHFVHALQVNAAIGARLWVTRTNCDRAGALRRRGRPGDHERAAALEATVRATASELGLTALAAAATR